MRMRITVLGSQTEKVAQKDIRMLGYAIPDVSGNVVQGEMSLAKSERKAKNHVRAVWRLVG